MAQAATRGWFSRPTTYKAKMAKRYRAVRMVSIPVRFSEIQTVAKSPGSAYFWLLGQTPIR